MSKHKKKKSLHNNPSLQHTKLDHNKNEVNKKETIEDNPAEAEVNDDKLMDEAVADAQAKDDLTKSEANDNIASENKESNTASVNDDNISDEAKVAEHKKKKRKFDIFSVLRIACIIGFIVFSALFINEVFIEPYRNNKSIEEVRSLYNKPSITVTVAPTQAPVVTEVTVASPAAVTVIPTPTPTPDPSRDEQGRLLQFKDLLERNEDVKGWITIPDSNIDYVVLQSSQEDPEFYLNRDFDKNELKAGSIFLDSKSSVEEPSKNMTIHGHNMYSTDNMFHYLVNYKELDYYKARPVFTFDTIYETGQWKIFSVFITNGSSQREELFDYTRAEFVDDSDYMNFIYNLRIRSIYNMDTVDVNEDDYILTLSTCSYEVKNYRTVIIARKLREGEDPTVDVDSVTINEKPLYPWSYYYRYGGKAPKFTETFEEALSKGEINWYIPPTD